MRRRGNLPLGSSALVVLNTEINTQGEEGTVFFSPREGTLDDAPRGGDKDQGTRIKDKDHGPCFGTNEHPRRDTDVILRLSKSTIEDLPF